MMKRVIVFIAFLVSLVSVGLVKCSNTGPYAEGKLHVPHDTEKISTQYIYSE
jgi:hypothetical protein